MCCVPMLSIYQLSNSVRSFLFIEKTNKLLGSKVALC